MKLKQIMAQTKRMKIKRLLDFDSKKSKSIYSKRGVLFSASTNTINSRPINFYNQGVPAKSWNIEPEKLKRNSFKVFSTGDAFSVMSQDIEIGGAHINIHVGTEHASYSPLTLIQEGLQLCRCASEHGAKSITIALPEKFHPVLYYGDYNSLLIKLFKASGADRIYFYDQNYKGKLDDTILNAVIPLAIAQHADQANYLIDANDLLKYLQVGTSPQSQDDVSLDNQVMQSMRQYNFDRHWLKFKIDPADNYVVESDETATLKIPEIKVQPHVVLCCSANKPLAESIAASLRRCGEMVKLYHIQGEGAQAQIPADAVIHGAVVTIVQSTRPNPDDFTKTDEYQKNGTSPYFSEVEIIARQAHLRGAETINLIDPYQFNARSDKAEDNPKGKTGAYVQQNGMLLEASGVNHVVTAECHDNHTMSGSYTRKKIKGSAVQALSVIATKIATHWAGSAMEGQLRLVTPDAGAAKRTKELTQQLQAILGKKLCQSRVLGEKQRDSHKDDSALINSLNSGDVKINPKDKFVITDDETATGTTLCGAIVNLKNQGAEDIEVIVVHNNMPLEWMSRQLCLARFLYLGVSALHFSDTQEMGTLAKSYEDLIQQQKAKMKLSTSTVEKEVYNWFISNICTDSEKKSWEQIEREFNYFQDMFENLESSIKIHSLADEFAHQVATKPYMGNPHAFAYKVNEYIRKIENSEAKSIAVFEGASVAAASAAAVALDLPLQIIPTIIPDGVNPELSLPDKTFVLIGTPDELTLKTLEKDTGYDGAEMLHSPSDPDGDLAIVARKASSPIQKQAPMNTNIEGLLSQIENIVQMIQQDNKLKETPIKLLGIGVEGQLLAGQLSYLLNKKGINLGIAAVDNKQALHSNPVVYSGHAGDQRFSIDRNSLDMGDICIAVAAQLSPDAQTALQNLATEAKVHYSYSCTLSAEAANTQSAGAMTRSGLLFFPNRDANLRKIPAPAANPEQGLRMG